MAYNPRLIIIIGGILAIIGQFLGTEYYLSLIGGIVALIGGLLLKK